MERIPTSLERRIEIRSEFSREAGVFRKTDGVMHEIALKRCDRLLDQYLTLELEMQYELSEPVQPPHDGLTI